VAKPTKKGQTTLSWKKAKIPKKSKEISSNSEHSL
jgi:hypothetical protein